MIEYLSRNCTRIIIYVKNNVKASRIMTLELEDFSCIWLEVGLLHMNKFLLGGINREQGHIKVNSDDTENHSQNQKQEECWSRFLGK